MPADMTKSSAALNKRVSQKPVEIGLNPQTTHKGALRDPNANKNLD